MTITNTEAVSERVTRDDALAFLETACRNWRKMPKLSEEDIGDVASALLRFALSRRSANTAAGGGVNALVWSRHDSVAFIAQSSFGPYMAEPWGDAFRAWLPDDTKNARRALDGLASLDAAKAAAQADFNQRILSAIDRQHTTCAVCGEDKHTPLRRDEMGGYVCLTCIDKALSALTSPPAGAVERDLVMLSASERACYEYPDDQEKRAAFIFGAGLYASALHPAPEHNDVREAPTHRHVKRGTEYVLIGIGKMQAEGWVELIVDAPLVGTKAVDMREVAIYRSVDDGSLWVRPREEFEDGRFEALTAALGKAGA